MWCNVPLTMDVGECSINLMKIILLHYFRTWGGGVGGAVVWGACGGRGLMLVILRRGKHWVVVFKHNTVTVNTCLITHQH